MTRGGQLVLGVADDRRIVGVDDTDRVGRDVDNVATNNCEPPATVIQEVITAPDAPGGPVLVVNAPKGDQRPYRTNRGVYFVRTSTGRRRASQEELLRLFQAAESLQAGPHRPVQHPPRLTITKSTLAPPDPSQLVWPVKQIGKLAQRPNDSPLDRSEGKQTAHSSNPVKPSISPRPDQSCPCE